MIVKEKKSQKNSIVVTIINKKKKSHVVLKLVHLHWTLVILNHHLADNLLFEFGTQFWIQMLRFKKFMFLTVTAVSAGNDRLVFVK